MRFPAAVVALIAFVLPCLSADVVAGTDVETPSKLPLPTTVSELAAAKDAESATVQFAVGLDATSTEVAAAGSDAPTEGAAEAQPSAAEKIARLEASLENDEKRLEQLNASLNAPESDYAKAQASFRELDSQRTALQQKILELENTEHANELAQAQEESAGLEKKWTLAKERFDLAIGERKAMQESVSTLQRKLEGDRASLLKLKNAGEPQRLGASPPGQPQSEQIAPTVELPRPNPSIAAPPAVSPQPVAPESTAPAPVTNAPLPSSLEPKQASLPDTAASAPPILTKKIAQELAVASEAAQKSQAAAQIAEDEARTITDRMELLRQDIELQRQLRDMARKTVDNLEKTLQSLNEDLFRKLMAGEKIDEVRQQIEEATQRQRDNRTKSREISTHLDELQSQLTHLQSEKLAAATDLTKKRDQAVRAQAIVEKLKNPFTARNLAQWLIDHGPRIVSILLALALFMWLSRLCERRLVELTAKRGRRGSREERENRAKTLLGIFRNMANIAIVSGGVMMILDEVGVPVAPIVGSAAVLGLAVAFGAQSLIKDYFVGFMVLLEQQYLVNDVIEIGPIKGQVERISLRITVLRDLEGRVHFIPHSQISTVTNMTHGWSRAVFDIGVAYKENVDHVIEVLTSLADELRRDENYKLLMLSDPVMLGVDSFGNSAVIIKFYLQTRPLQQWTVKREMLRRIKNEFDRQGIEIPFPHMTIYQGAAQLQHERVEQTTDEWKGRRSA